MFWDYPDLWGDDSDVIVTVDPDPEVSWVHSLPALSADQQATYNALVRTHHRVGSWVQILDENERPMWELRDITDGGVSFDLSSVPDRSLDVTVLDIGGRLLSGAVSEEAAEARRFVRLIIEKETADGWLRFPMFTGPLSSGGLRRQGAEVSIRAAGKESLYLEPYTTWTAHHYPKGTLISSSDPDDMCVLRDLAYDQGERHFRLPDLTARLAKRLVVPRFSEAWKYIRRAAGKAGQTPYFDGEGYLCLRPSHPKTVAYTFDEDVVLTPPEVDDDYTTIVNQGFVTGPNPEGPEKPLHIPISLTPPNPFSPPAMARHGVPRRSIAHDQLDSKKRSVLEAHARSLLRVAQKQISFDCLPVPHVVGLIGRVGRITGEFEGQTIDDRFTIRRGFYPATPNAPMTIGSWKPIAANWKAIHGRPHFGSPR